MQYHNSIEVYSPVGMTEYIISSYAPISEYVGLMVSILSDVYK